MLCGRDTLSTLFQDILDSQNYLLTPDLRQSRVTSPGFRKQATAFQLGGAETTGFHHLNTSWDECDKNKNRTLRREISHPVLSTWAAWTP